LPRSFDFGLEISFWKYWRSSPVMLGVDLGLGNRAIYAELQVTPSEEPLLGVALGAVRPEQRSLGFLGLQGTAWYGLGPLLLYLRLERYRRGALLLTGGFMLKLPIFSTGSIM
jgi:hypothetical protein